MTVPPPIPPPEGFRVFHGAVSGMGGIQYHPSIPIGDVDARRWVFTWGTIGQWVTPQFIPTVEHWVAIPSKSKQ